MPTDPTALARIAQQAKDREAGVQHDMRHAKRSGHHWDAAELAQARSFATVRSMRLDDLQTLLAALSIPPVEREPIARIIDPLGFELGAKELIADALDKADAILALIASKPIA